MLPVIRLHINKDNLGNFLYFEESSNGTLKEIKRIAFDTNQKRARIYVSKELCEDIKEFHGIDLSKRYDLIFAK